MSSLVITPVHLDTSTKIPKPENFLSNITKEEIIWYPQKISDVDRFTQKILSYGEELDADHPGFTDSVYRKRRLGIAALAKNYKYGEPIPRVDYLETELETWRKVYLELKQIYRTHACKQYLQNFRLLEELCGYSPDTIPQLEDVSNFLKERTGWTVKPVTGLLTSRDFLNGLAFKVFHATQYIRHQSQPLYTPEPDVCHELLGHVPLFADPDFAAFSQEIGLASLGISDEDIEKLAGCYMFTVEFGLCKQTKAEGDEEIKVFGAGLLSSSAELIHCLTPEATRVPFDPAVAAKTPFPLSEFQPTYFVAESFEKAKKQLLEFSKSFARPFGVHYNPVTQSIEKTR